MADAWTRFERLRWGGPPSACPVCRASGRCSRLPADPGERRVWRCAACRAQFSVLTGTLLERTRVPLPVWRALVADLVADAELSARALARRHSLTPATTRLLVARLAAAGVGAGSGEAADGALGRVLRLPPEEVERIRRSTPARRFVREGPSADYR